MGRKLIEMEVGGMSCRRCVETVGTALQQVPGVLKATVDLDTNWALVTADDRVHEEELAQAVESVNYTIRIATPVH